MANINTTFHIMSPSEVWSSYTGAIANTTINAVNQGPHKEYPFFKYRIPIYYQRRDAKVSPNKLQERERRYRSSHIYNVLANFERLGVIYPMDERGPRIYTFYGDRQISTLFIESIPSIVLLIQRDGVHLAEILPSNNKGQVERFKRLFLRHLGFNCTRYYNKLKIQYKDGNSILVKPTERYKFNTFSKEYTLIGSLQKPLHNPYIKWKL